jgi:hypothetical protein
MCVSFLRSTCQCYLHTNTNRGWTELSGIWAINPWPLKFPNLMLLRSTSNSTSGTDLWGLYYGIESVVLHRPQVILVVPVCTAELSTGYSQHSRRPAGSTSAFLRRLYMALSVSRLFQLYCTHTTPPAPYNPHFHALLLYNVSQYHPPLHTQVLYQIVSSIQIFKLKISTHVNFRMRATCSSHANINPLRLCA